MKGDFGLVQDWCRIGFGVGLARECWLVEMRQIIIHYLNYNLNSYTAPEH